MRGVSELARRVKERGGRARRLGAHLRFDVGIGIGEEEADDAHRDDADAGGDAAEFPDLHDEHLRRWRRSRAESPAAKRR